jgi:hypothetical protein
MPGRRVSEARLLVGTVSGSNDKPNRGGGQAAAGDKQICCKLTPNFTLMNYFFPFGCAGFCPIILINI